MMTSLCHGTLASASASALALAWPWECSDGLGLGLGLGLACSGLGLGVCGLVNIPGFYSCNSYVYVQLQSDNCLLKILID